MDSSQQLTPTPSAITATPTSEERAMQNARLFRFLATPSYLATPAKKRQASDIVAEAKAKGLMDSFEGMDEWFRTEPVKKIKNNNNNSSAKNHTSNRVSSNEDDYVKEFLDTPKIKLILEQAGKMILNRLPVDATLPPFVASDTNTRMIKQSPFIREIETTPQGDCAAWQALLDMLIEQKANPLAITWISEHVLHLSMTPTQQALRQTAREQWQRFGGKQFNPVYASRDDLVALLTRK